MAMDRNWLIKLKHTPTDVWVPVLTGAASCGKRIPESRTQIRDSI